MLYHPIKIGSLCVAGNLFLAPVAGYSDRAFRSICVKGGANFTYTEMVSSEALTRGSYKTLPLMARSKDEKAYAVQLFGGKAEIMANAARIVLLKTTADCIDINCGCPVQKIVKTGAGSALTRDPEKLYEITAAVVKAVKSFEEERPCVFEQCNKDDKKYKEVPVTVKIRSGWDSDHLTWKEAAQAAIEAGAAAITLHPRTRAQGYEGTANWNLLAALVEFVKGRIPVFGSGDAFSPETAKKMLEQTHCDAVMFARGAMGHPFIFRQTRDLLMTDHYTDVSVKERITAGFSELDLLVLDKGELHACREMRKRFCAYSKGITGGPEIRKKLVTAETVADYKDILGVFLGN